MKRLIILVFISTHLLLYSQNQFNEAYEAFRKGQIEKYRSHRDECNKKYVDFLRTAWKWYQRAAPMQCPKEENPVPPCPYNDGDVNEPITIAPMPVLPMDDNPQPLLVEPIREVPQPEEDQFTINFFDLSCNVRIPIWVKSTLRDSSPQSIAAAWENLCADEMNNTIRDCLETRIRYNLCDWAYLSFLVELSNRFCTDRNSATLLMAYLYCQSGYQMRLAVDNGDLCMLYGSKHKIYGKGYFSIDGLNFYPYGSTSNSISICNAEFDGEKPMSLLVMAEQRLGGIQFSNRCIKSSVFQEVVVECHVPENLINFYDSYPTSEIGNNPMTRWAMYANVPMAQMTKDVLYPSLKEVINDCDELSGANKLLNWVQTGFVYEYDDKVWGYDRAFFAEETLYYPYCDCEDRSILFSRLVRDLLGLDVALIYYPGHLATAVCFNENVRGDVMLINGRKFIVCDPTYIGAPVGAQMPDLEYDKVQAILLKR